MSLKTLGFYVIAVTILNIYKKTGNFSTRIYFIYISSI